MRQDMKERDTRARTDDEARRHKIATARNIIYNKNYAVDGDRVNAVLKEEYLTPTKVSSLLCQSC